MSPFTKAVTGVRYWRPLFRPTCSTIARGGMRPAYRRWTGLVTTLLNRATPSMNPTAPSFHTAEPHCLAIIITLRNEDGRRASICRFRRRYADCRQAADEYFARRRGGQECRTTRTVAREPQLDSVAFSAGYRCALDATMNSPYGHPEGPGRCREPRTTRATQAGTTQGGTHRAVRLSLLRKPQQRGGTQRHV